jgi:mitochondrial ornithine carrier protein
MAAYKNEPQQPLPTLTPSTQHPPLNLTPTPPSQTFEAIKDIAYGSTAGILGKFVEYPFDTVKVRLQSQSHDSLGPKLRGPLDAFSAAFRSPEGPIVSLYRGISAPLLGAAIETSSLFFSYRIAQDLVVSSSPTLRAKRDANPTSKVELPFPYLLGCGAASGAFTSLLLTPIELVKCKMQVPAIHAAQSPGGTATAASLRPPTAIQLISQIFRTQGLSGFWHGQLGTLIRETGGSAAWFGSYEGLKILFRRNTTPYPVDGSFAEVKVWQQMIAGALAGMSYNFVFYPADTIKSRMQTAASETKGTFLRTGAELWQESGVKGFYRGCGITVFRAAPSSAIIFSIYEALRKYFG